MGIIPNLTYEQSRKTAQTLRSLADDLLLIYDPAYLEALSPDVTLSNWSMIAREHLSLMGMGKGHPTIEPGLMRTSEVYFLDERRGLLRTYSRWYRLGPKAIRLKPDQMN